MGDIARHIIFSGRVQGVGFRYTAQRSANRHGLTGFVRNLPDETVEMLAQGRPDSVRDCIQDIGEAFGSYLEKTNIDDIRINDIYDSFVITY